MEGGRPDALFIAQACRERERMKKMKGQGIREFERRGYEMQR